MASELASARQAIDITLMARGKGKAASFENMLGDLERVRAALRAGAQPQQIFGKDSLTRRALTPDAIAHGPDGDVLSLVRWGRATVLGRTWDEERAERARSRSPRVKMGGNRVPLESKGAIAATITDAPDP